MKGLLIAYSFSPDKNVGALRPTYWAEEINQFDGMSLDVVTATPLDNSDKPYKRTVVANNSKSFWSFLIKDEGLTWRKDLLKYFKSTPIEEYDFVLFTGGPFFHFSLGKYLKKKGLKVIFDFRDPYSYNPRHNDKGLKKGIKIWFENKNLQQADLVITVNDACHEYIGNGLKLNRQVIPNGFDERIIPKEKTDKLKYDLFYAGRFYWEPTDFFDGIQASDYSLAHAGVPQNYPHAFLQGNRFIQLGMLSQKEMYKELLLAEIGVVFTIDVPFESTTKLYDYLALNKKILVITQGEPHTGVIKRELENYPNYRWVMNDKEDILTAIKELKESPLVEFNATIFSRKQSLKNLVHQIKILFNA
ncbi:MAG TPA: hypothetical protein EYG86_00700 [Crocinitomicaceae bacterium]|nr:hypothetical protein [Crocinitomicaceae bacterium]